MGYPDTFKIEVSDTQAYRQFGNSVAVPVVTALAKQVMAALQNQSRAGSGAALLPLDQGAGRNGFPG